MHLHAWSSKWLSNHNYIEQEKNGRGWWAVHLQRLSSMRIKEKAFYQRLLYSVMWYYVIWKRGTNMSEQSLFYPENGQSRFLHSNVGNFLSDYMASLPTRKFA
jgi:hypothetical protein